MKMAFYTPMRIRWGSPKPFFKRFFWTNLVVIIGGLALGTNIGYQYQCQFLASMSVLGTVWFSNICYYQITIAAFKIAISLYKTIHYRARSSWVSTTWTLSTLVEFGCDFKWCFNRRRIIKNQSQSTVNTNPRIHRWQITLILIAIGAKLHQLFSQVL